ncbi:MAG: protein-glutamate O-methyltransferase CheR [Pseudomonadota bacterium]
MPDAKAELSDLDFEKLRSIVHKSTGITIGENRKTMLMGRLRARLRDTNAPSIRAYITRLGDDVDEMQHLIDRVTTNKTYCYRTPRVWEHFTQTAVTAFLTQKINRPMRVWSAAASTGEEAHTIGVMLEGTRLSEPGFNYAVLGTDVSQRVLDLAETGSYADAAVAPLRTEQPEAFSKFMRADDAGAFSVLPDIKSRIKFKRHNLNERLRGTRPFDVVFLRNVLIYFAPEDQENILRNVHELLDPNGYLYIGESETLTRLRTDFEAVEPLIYRPVTASSRPLS